MVKRVIEGLCICTLTESDLGREVSLFTFFINSPLVKKNVTQGYNFSRTKLFCVWSEKTVLVFASNILQLDTSCFCKTLDSSCFIKPVRLFRFIKPFGLFLFLCVYIIDIGSLYIKYYDKIVSVLFVLIILVYLCVWCEWL